MLSDVLMFSCNLLLTGVLIFILVYFLITLSDLECDYLNAHECTGKLNFWNVPKLWLQLMIVFLLLVSGHWILFLVNLPISVFLTRRFFKVPRGNEGEYDPCEIYNTGQLRRHLQGVFLHIGWQFFGFFVYLYCLLDAVMSEPVGVGIDDVIVLHKPAAREVYDPLPEVVGRDL